jgi:hypothetical protein
MYVRLITFHLKPEISREHADIVYDALIDVLRGCRGFEGMSGMINEESDLAVSLSYWRDQECASEAGARSLPLLIEQVHELVDRPPEITGYEVVRQDLPRL